MIISKKGRWCWIACFFSLSTSGETLKISNFDTEGLEGWEAVNFNNETHYDVFKTERGRVIRAVSRDSASGMLKKTRIDLSKTPYLNWSWTIEKSLKNLDEKTRAGDDYAARVYVVIKDGLFFWQTKALIYTWTGSQPVGELWPNAFTSNSQMLSVENGDTNAGKWVSEKHNVFEDLKRAFGKDMSHIDGVAIMTDTDNSDGQATAYYGEIYFTAK